MVSYIVPSWDIFPLLWERRLLDSLDTIVHIYVESPVPVEDVSQHHFAVSEKCDLVKFDLQLVLEEL